MVVFWYILLNSAYFHLTSCGIIHLILNLSASLTMLLLVFSSFVNSKYHNIHLISSFQSFYHMIYLKALVFETWTNVVLQGRIINPVLKDRLQDSTNFKGQSRWLVKISARLLQCTSKWTGLWRRYIPKTGKIIYKRLQSKSIKNIFWG